MLSETIGVVKTRPMYGLIFLCKFNAVFLDMTKAELNSLWLSPLHNFFTTFVRFSCVFHLLDFHYSNT